jgi:hypothetical protein
MMSDEFHREQLERVTGGRDAHPGEVATSAGIGGLASAALALRNGYRSARSEIRMVKTEWGVQLAQVRDLNPALRRSVSWGVIGAAATGLADYAIQKMR